MGFGTKKTQGAARAITDWQEKQMSNYSLIKQAIETKKPVHATYQGRHREMCPHTLGKGKDGKTMALFLQYGGSSSKGLDPDPAKNWRCIDIDDLTNLKIVDDEWQTATNHSQPQSCVKVIEVVVKF